MLQVEEYNHDSEGVAGSECKVSQAVQGVAGSAGCRRLCCEIYMDSCTDLFIVPEYLRSTEHVSHD